MEGLCVCVHEYVEEIHGHCNAPNHTTFQGENLGYWVASRRKDYSKGILSKNRIKALEEIGIEWSRM